MTCIAYTHSRDNLSCVCVCVCVFCRGSQQKEEQKGLPVKSGRHTKHNSLMAVLSRKLTVQATCLCKCPLNRTALSLDLGQCPIVSVGV